MRPTNGADHGDFQGRGLAARADGVTPVDVGEEFGWDEHIGSAETKKTRQIRDKNRDFVA